MTKATKNIKTQRLFVIFVIFVIWDEPWARAPREDV